MLVEIVKSVIIELIDDDINEYKIAESKGNKSIDNRIQYCKFIEINFHPGFVIIKFRREDQATREYYNVAYQDSEISTLNFITTVVEES